MSFRERIWRQNHWKNTAFVAFAALSLGLGMPAPAYAEPRSDQVVKFIVPTTAGSPLDVMARFLANRLSGSMGQNMIVENKPGAGTTIGSKIVATANPDGNTLLFTSVSHAVSAAMYKHLDYDPVSDFSPVAAVANSSWVLVVSPNLPVKSVAELITYAKANPENLNFGFGVGTAPHLLGELFKAKSETSIVSIPYKGGAPALADLLSGQIHMLFGTTATLLPLIRDGKLRALATTSKTRNPDLPDVPTMTEAGLPGLTQSFWLGVLAPAHTPNDIIKKLNGYINATLKPAEVKTTMAKLGFEPSPGSSEDFAKFLAADVHTWASIVKSAGVKTN